MIQTNKIWLAPMAGITDSAFRRLCLKHNAGLVFTEMVSAKGLYYKNENTADLLYHTKEERPIGVQIFGSDPKIMAYSAAKMTEKGDFDLLDINMGCPAPKIVKNGDGSALMKDLKLIGEIVRAVSYAVKIPVTVKIRSGFDKNNINAVEAAKIIEQNGGAMVAVHGRTREQQYRGEADWEIITKVKQAVKIPVIGNGDVTSPEKALKMFEETGCDAIMIGRAAQGDPWIFERCVHFIKTREILPPPTFKERIDAALNHLEEAIAEKSEFVGIAETRKHLHWYTKGMPGASEARAKLNKAESINEIKEIFALLLCADT